MPEDPVKSAMKLSVQDRTTQQLQEESPITFYFSTIADEIPIRPGLARDKALNTFWRQEPILAGCIYSMASKVAALDFRLKGKTKAVARYRKMFLQADFNNGWTNLMQKVVQDYLTCDNGSVIEILRDKGAGPKSPVRGIAHLDSQRIKRTGNLITPILYRSQKDGKYHKLKYYQVLSLVDQPSPREEQKGVGLCAVSRILETAKIMRAIRTYQIQKLSGMRLPGILFVQGLRQNAIKNALEKAKEESRSQGRTAYLAPVILSSHDAARPLRADLIELAGMPDGVDLDSFFKHYIASLALAFGTDYSEFSPLPGGNLGSGQQTTEMASRSRGKGPGVILNQVEFGINWQILPQTVEFQFASTDPSAERERIELGVWRARKRKEMWETGEITSEQALKLAIQAGDAPESFLHEDDTEDRVDVLVKSLADIKESYDKVEKVLCRLRKPIKV